MKISAPTINITDYVNVRQRATDLGCRCPERIALLPINFESANSIGELLQASEASTIKTLLLAEAVPLDDIVDRNQRPPYVKNKSHEWIAPIMFISGSLYSQNPALVSVALNVLGNYATEFFRGSVGSREVNLNVVVGSKNGSHKKIAYQGPVEGLKNLVDIIREVAE
jgi:hypothetical protein